MSQGPQAIVYNTVAQQLFVSNFKSHDSRNTVGCFKLTKDLSQENVLMSNRRARLIRNPQAIVYNTVDHHILVSCGSSDAYGNTVDSFIYQ